MIIWSDWTWQSFSPLLVYHETTANTTIVSSSHFYTYSNSITIWICHNARMPASLFPCFWKLLRDVGFNGWSETTRRRTTDAILSELRFDRKNIATTGSDRVTRVKYKSSGRSFPSQNRTLLYSLSIDCHSLISLL